MLAIGLIKSQLHFKDTCKSWIANLLIIGS